MNYVDPMIAKHKSRQISRLPSNSPRVLAAKARRIRNQEARGSDAQMAAAELRRRAKFQR